MKKFGYVEPKSYFPNGLKTTKNTKKTKNTSNSKKKKSK